MHIYIYREGGGGINMHTIQATMIPSRDHGVFCSRSWQLCLRSVSQAYILAWYIMKKMLNHIVPMILINNRHDVTRHDMIAQHLDESISSSFLSFLYV
jgi:hypothetical protein